MQKNGKSTEVAKQEAQHAAKNAVADWHAKGPSSTQGHDVKTQASKTKDKAATPSDQGETIAKPGYQGATPNDQGDDLNENVFQRLTPPKSWSWTIRDSPNSSGSPFDII